MAHLALEVTACDRPSAVSVIQMQLGACADDVCPTVRTGERGLERHREGGGVWGSEELLGVGARAFP
jgi:hypothetical protein